MDNSKQLEELQKTLNTIYIKNLEFFKKNVPNIYNKILEFEKLNIENYSLEFRDNNFCLIYLENSLNLYEVEPFTDSINRVNNFSVSSAFNLIKIEYLKKRNHYNNEINAYEYLNQFIDNFQNIDITINKFIFIGTLLGVHINDFHKVLKANTYLIIEPNIEIFRLSMFMTDYEILSKDSKLFFAVGENSIELNKIIKDFMKYKYEFNNFIHYELVHKNNEEIINELTKSFTYLGEMRYPFSEFLISLKRGYNYFFEEKNILNLSQKYSFLKNKKVLFLGAGVSLEKNFEWLYLNQEEFIIVASSAVLKHLKILDIVPDIILAIDGQKDVMLEQFNTVPEMYKNSIILVSIKLDYELFSTKLKDTKIFFMQNALELFTGFGFLRGVTVGDLGVDILAKLGSNEIYLLGVDASIDGESGKTHIGTHNSSRKIDLNKKDSGNFRDDIVYTKGNFEKFVPTFREYLDMIDSLEEIISNHKNSLKVYNLGSGAYFKGSFPLKVDNFNYEKIDKEIFKNEFLSSLKNISKQKLDSIDIKDIQKEENVLKKLNGIKVDNFYKEFKIVFENYPNSIICNILDRFFKLVLPYFYMLKDRDLANEILEKQIYEILNSFNSIFDKMNDKSLKI